MTSALPLDDTLAVVIDGELPEAGVDLFHSARFHMLSVRQRPPGARAHAFTLVHRRSGAALGAARFVEDEPGHFHSPGRGSYGGLQIAAGHEQSLATMEAFAAQVEAFLVEQGARFITIVLPPLAYDPPQTSAWINILLRHGFSLARHELSYAVDVGPLFLELIDHGNRKQLKKCEREGLVCEVLGPSDQEAAYAVLDENRRKKGNALSMTWPALQELGAAFPAAVRWSGVRRPGEGHDALVAAAVALRINPRVLYVLYWGEGVGSETLSPVTVLARELYEHCLTERIAVLDVGTSTLHGVPNHGLIRYKKNLGCQASLKLTLTKALP